MSALGDRLAVALIALERIGARLALSLSADGGAFPVTPTTVRSDIYALERDAFLQRFQQASDHMLRKLFPRTQAAITGSADFQPMRDSLEALHRARIIDDPEPWMVLLELRNRLTHEYTLSDAELAQDINAAWDLSPMILAQIDRIRAYALQHDLLDGASL